MLKSPFPYYGGKSAVAADVWQRFGDVAHLIEPFAGSLAILLRRPHYPFDGRFVRSETVNDVDSYLANFWRALAADPAAVARYADWPVNEVDLHSRHLWLVNQAEFRERMVADPDYYDAKIAGWWVWGISAWIGGGWCEVRERPERRIIRIGTKNTVGIHRESVKIQRPHISRAGMGVHGKRPQVCHYGKGIHQSTHNNGMGAYDNGMPRHEGLHIYMQELAARLRYVRVTCGDWSRVVTPAVIGGMRPCGVFLDPPYSTEANRAAVYANEDFTIAYEVREWCLANGDNPDLRIALCGYQGEGHEALEAHGWTVQEWKANGGYSNQGEGNENKHKERIWYSPHCLPVQSFKQLDLLAANGRAQEPL